MWGDMCSTLIRVQALLKVPLQVKQPDNGVSQGRTLGTGTLPKNCERPTTGPRSRAIVADIAAQVAMWGAVVAHLLKN